MKTTIVTPLDEQPHLRKDLISHAHDDSTVIVKTTQDIEPILEGVKERAEIERDLNLARRDRNMRPIAEIMYIDFMKFYTNFKK